MGLNPAQRTALRVELQHLETALRTARRLMHAPEQAILTRYQPVPEATRLRLEPFIEQALALVGTLAEQFDLRPEVLRMGRHIEADMAVAWAGLYDTLSAKLSRYGEVDPALADTLDPEVLRLIHLTEAIGLIAMRDP
jgi:hypothetical protein